MRLIVISIAVLTLAGCANASKAETKAEEWVAMYRPGCEVKTPPKCELSDSDNDGRVRCNMTIQCPEQPMESPSIECPAGWLPQPFKRECQTVKGGGWRR